MGTGGKAGMGRKSTPRVRLPLASAAAAPMGSFLFETAPPVLATRAGVANLELAPNGLRNEARLARHLGGWGNRLGARALEG